MQKKKCDFKQVFILGKMKITFFFSQNNDFSSNQVQIVPVNKCGNLIGKMTASFSASLAESNPATSDHCTLGFSITMAPKLKTNQGYNEL